MKPNRRPFRAVWVLPAILLAAGCREYTTVTTLRPDGSAERSVTVSGDSAAVDSLFSGPFAVPVDSTWSVRVEKDSTGEKRTRTTVTKVFRKPAELNRAYAEMPGEGLRVKVVVDWKRKFRWFNTFYEYNETLKACNPFSGPPIGDFLDGKEMALYHVNHDTLGLEKKVERWFAKSAVEELVAKVAEAAGKAGDPGLTPERVEATRDSLAAFLERNIDLEDKAGGSDAEKTVRLLERFYGRRVPPAVGEAAARAAEDISRKWEFIAALDTDSYAFEAVLPGLLVDTNAASVEGSRVSWKPEASRFLWEDYTLHAESRVHNPWAVYATALIALALAAGLAVSMRRRR